ncbi:MAG: DapH/DapD/GlmU-related protein [Leadbetterella sp.]|nr:DapH/DapD/GlmU-related protein [Leadbetterella sp.]
MQKLVFINGLNPRPINSDMARFLFFLNKIPVFRNLFIFKRAFCKVYNIPFSTSFGSGFYCSAPNVSLGENVGLADTLILAYAPVRIGNNCSFSYRNIIITSSHDFNDFSKVIASPVTIGNNVWVTTNVIILPGVTIGDNTVIGAGSVVTKDIPPGVFAAGNPCRVIEPIDFKK